MWWHPRLACLACLLSGQVLLLEPKRVAGVGLPQPLGVLQVAEPPERLGSSDPVGSFLL